MNNTLVTVGVALYNHNKYIVKCLESIVKQTYKNIELIVIDDGSPDNSYQVAKEYLESQNFNKNFKIISRPNKGMCNTLNEIISMASGDYFSFVGSDDCWYLEKIQLQVEFLDKNLDVDLVHSNSTYIDENDNITGNEDFSNRVNSGNLYEAMIYGKGGINTPSYLLRKKVFDEIGMFDPNFKFEDTDFFLRLTKRYNVGYINKELSFHRRHGKNLSDSSNMLKFYYDELIKIYKKDIEEEDLFDYAVSRVLRKSYKRALRTFKLNYFFYNLYRYINFKITKRI